MSAAATMGRLRMALGLVEHDERRALTSWHPARFGVTGDALAAALEALDELDEHARTYPAPDDVLDDAAARVAARTLTAIR